MEALKGQSDAERERARASFERKQFWRRVATRQKGLAVADGAARTDHLAQAEGLLALALTVRDGGVPELGGGEKGRPGPLFVQAELLRVTPGGAAPKLLFECRTQPAHDATHPQWNQTVHLPAVDVARTRLRLTLWARDDTSRSAEGRCLGRLELDLWRAKQLPHRAAQAALDCRSAGLLSGYEQIWEHTFDAAMRQMEEYSQLQGLPQRLAWLRRELRATGLPDAALVSGMDEDASGSICEREFVEGLHAAGVNLGASELGAVFAHIAGSRVQLVPNDSMVSWLSRADKEAGEGGEALGEARRGWLSYELRTAAHDVHSLARRIQSIHRGRRGRSFVRFVSDCRKYELQMMVRVDAAASLRR